MPSDDAYATLPARSRAGLTVRGSRFLASAAPVLSREECERELQALRREYHDATHHPYAYRLAPDGAQFRTHDDGEPAGSAGAPILAAIDAAALVGVIVVVTRYFGGTKLGIGPLARAYREAASGALGAAGRETRYVCEILSVCLPHGRVGAVMRAVSGYGGRIARTQYDADVLMEIEIRRSRCGDLRSALLDATAGEITFTGR